MIGFCATGKISFLRFVKRIQQNASKNLFILHQNQYHLYFSALNSHFHSGQCLFLHSQTSKKPIITLSSSPSSPNCRYKTSEINVNKSQANAGTVNDQQNLSLNLCLRYQKPHSEQYISAAMSFSHIADTLLFGITYIFARRRLLLR